MTVTKPPVVAEILGVIMVTVATEEIASGTGAENVSV